jgi:secreted Zn-dependent insulinase-like peptidase
VLLLTACQALSPRPGVIASDTDARDFRYLELPNRLRVLLISDPGADKAAAALDVEVGSRQDPAERPGLAHFLEHMLFLGTERYPTAGDYQKFISAHGGSHNAYTAFEHTNYFFDIDAAYLEPALDRFSQFFVSPLFSAEYVQREKNAVHSEYVANIRDDARRGLDVLRAVVNPDHPFSQFSVGTLDTLADLPGRTVRDDLLAFYAQHYSANRMTLVVSGREDLDALQAMVTARFAAVPDRDRDEAAIAVPLFAEGALPVLVQVEPVKQERDLSFVWAIDDTRKDYRGKSLAYIGNIVGHEGEGSLLSWLKAQGWARGLSAGEGFEYQGGSTFNVSVQLTEAGVAHVDEIAAALQQTLELIRSEGVVERLYREQQQIAEQRFRFRERPGPVREASRLALNLHKYPAAEVMRGDYLMESFEPERIAALLAKMTPERVLVMLTAPGVETDRASLWYDTPYALQPLPVERIAGWRERMGRADIHLPEPNRFIAQRLDLKPRDDGGDEPRQLSGGALPAQGLRLWYQQDRRFGLPRGQVSIALRSPLAADSPRHAVMGELLVRMVAENLNEFAYPAQLAGLQFGLSHDSRGLQLRVQGFDDRQALLLEHLLRGLSGAEFEPARFERIRHDYRRQLENAAQQPPYNLVVGGLADVLFRSRWPDSELAALVDTVDTEQLAAFARQLLGALDVEMLVYGNFTEGDARELGALVAAGLLGKAAPVAPVPVEIARLSQDLQRTVPTPHDDAALLWYRQAADTDRTTRAALGVSAQILNADFYTRLRTEQQLGYIVMSSPYPLREVPGLLFLVQSPVAGPAQLAVAYDTFMAQWRERGPEELEPLFERHRAALIQRLSEQPKNQAEMAARLWQDLQDGYRRFDSREQLIGALRELDFEAWQALFQRDVLAPEGRGLWLAANGRFGEQVLQRGRVIGDLDAFKRDQPFYRFQ